MLTAWHFGSAFAVCSLAATVVVLSDSESVPLGVAQMETMLCKINVCTMELAVVQ